MIPGMNPRQMKHAMQRMGIAQEDLDAELVVIHLKDRELVIRNPQVAKIKMMGNESFQISGEVEERSKAVSITEEDIAMVMDQAKVSHEDAQAALESAGGDIAEAILALEKSAQE